jgi:integrase
MATVVKRQGKWFVQIRKKGYRAIYKTFLNKANATKWAKETEILMDKKVFEDYSDAETTTLGDLIRKYRDVKTPTKKGVREETYKLNFILRNDIAKINCLELRKHHIYKFKDEISEGRKPETINKYIHYIYTVWEYAREYLEISLPPTNPCKDVKKEKVKNTIERILTKQEYYDLLKHAKRSNLNILSDMIEFAYLTAMRFGEITKLKFSDIDTETSIAILRDTKNGEDREIPLSKRAIDIAERNRFGDVLFNINRNHFKHYFNQCCIRARVFDFRFHDLRACAITNMFDNGWTIPQVALVSGHKTWSELKRYTRIKPTQLVDQINQVQ